MPTDDEILLRVQRRATVLRRRQRLLVAGAASVTVVALLGGAMVAGSVGDGRDPVGVASAPTDPADGLDPATTATTAPDTACTTVPSDQGLAAGSPAANGSPSAPTDGSEPTGSLPAQGGPTPLPTVQASSTACPLQVGVVATYDAATRTVDLGVVVTAEARYDAHGFVVWDTADPVQVDLGAVERSPGSCDTEVDADAAAATLLPVQGGFTARTTYPSGGPKEVSVVFWASRCDGPVHQVEVTVTVPL